MTTNHHAPYDLGSHVLQCCQQRAATPRGERISKNSLSSDAGCNPPCMKMELLVIADQNAAVNTFPGLVHTARHTMRVGNTRSR